MQIEGRETRRDWTRIAMGAGAVAMSAYVAYEFQPAISGNTDAINTVVTIFSILAGFLIAVITLITDPILQQAKSWEELQLMKATLRRKLLRQRLLFFFYLLTLAAALGIFMVPEARADIRWWLETAFLFLATFVFLASFTLPGSLMKVQMDRYEAALDARRPNALKSLQASKS